MKSARRRSGIGNTGLYPRNPPARVGVVRSSQPAQAGFVGTGRYFQCRNRHVSVNQGFTLLELLVVIAVIALIGGLLFPVFAQAREKARQATCLSNCHQWGDAFMMYVQDWDETYPLGFGWSPSLGGWQWARPHMAPVGWRNGTAPPSRSRA